MKYNIDDMLSDSQMEIFDFFSSLIIEHINYTQHTQNC